MRDWWDWIACGVAVGLCLALTLPAIPGRGCIAARETRAANLIAELEGACKIYERDWNVYPPTGPAFESGPCIFVLSQPGPKESAAIELTGVF